MYYFIVNPHSRSGAAAEIWPRLEPIVRQSGVPYEAVLTQRPGEATELARAFTAPLCAPQEAPAAGADVASACTAPSQQTGTAGGSRILVAVGGDGTLNEVVNGIDSFEDLTLGYIPTGSGNDFARGLKLPPEPEAALARVLAAERTAALDLCTVSTAEGTVRRYLDSCGSGYDAQVCVDLLSSRFKKICNALHIGKLAYLAVGVGAFFRQKLGEGILTVDDGAPVRLHKIFFVSFQNFPYEGGGWRFAPGADPADGRISVCQIAGTGKFGLFPLMLSSRGGGHVGSKHVRMMTCKKAHLKLARPAALHTDGEVLPFSKEFTVSVEKGKLSILL
ncbi:MAG: diacylglycerol kinase family lipid kinase [Lachnospiraceae bacterium]|nr:diacylglycerol kinase family lipid kinase [Lachnospiraceae bacterium]